MPTGKIKFFNTVRGYGFVVPDGGGPDVFVHATAVEDAGIVLLKEGDAITFELGASRDGRTKAVNLGLIANSLTTGTNLRRLP